MIAYIVKRLVSAVVIVFVLSAVIFFAARSFLAGTAAAALAGTSATPAEVAAIEHKLGLDRPLIVQFGDWLLKVLRGDLGVSPITSIPNGETIAQQAPISIELAFLSLLIAVVIGIPLGVVTASSRGAGADWGARIPFLVLFAIPGFVSGSILLYLAANYVPALYSPAFIPVDEDPLGNLAGMFLPAFSVGLPTSALVAQVTRSSMLEVLGQSYISSARTQGIPEWRIRYLYALKPALPPVLTILGLVFGLLIGGLLLTENIFSLPGLGRGVISAISSRDFDLLQAQAMLLAVAFILVNLVVDLIIPLIDRRITRS